MRGARIPLYGLLLAGVFCGGLTVHAASLDEAARAALSHHPDIEAASAAYQASRHEERAEESGYYPEFSMNAATGRVYGDNATSRGLSVTRGAGYSNMWEGTVNMRQMIFDGFETPSRVAAGTARRLSADMHVLDARESLSLRAAQAYLNVLRVHESLLALAAQRTALKDYINRIETAVDEGAADDSAYQQARDIALTLDSLIADFQGQKRLADSDYIEVTGAIPDTADMTRPIMPPDLLPGTVEDAVKQARRDHPAVQAASYSSRSAAHDIKAERAQLFPDVDGELSYLKSEKDDVIGGEVVDARALVRLNWRLETGGGAQARVRQKTAEHKESMAQLRSLQRRIERSVRQAYSEMQTAEALLRTMKDKAVLNAQMFETYDVQFEGARVTLLQLMQADQQLFNAKLERTQTEFRAHAARYAVLASLGRLSGLFVDGDEKTNTGSNTALLTGMGEMR